MNKKIRWGILGPGSIAHKFADGLKALPDAELIAVGSRSMEKANKFGDEYNIAKRYGSYEDFVKDPDIDIVYISSPHPFHNEHSLLCMKAGKSVICEKPFAVNARQAEEMIACAGDNKVFLMEAMWTRFLPVMAKVRELICEGTIGDVRMMTADFGFRMGWNPESRLLNPELAGGALLDVGVYTVSLASMVFSGPPTKIASLSHLGETCVDEQSAMLLGYDKGKIAVLSCAVRTNTPQEARIIGTDGSIYIPDFWRSSKISLFRQGKEADHIELPFEGNGYNCQAAEAMNCLRNGKLESDILPLHESLSIVQTLDSIRAQWGLKYPME